MFRTFVALCALALPMIAAGQVVETDDIELLEAPNAPAPMEKTPEVEKTEQLIIRLTNDFRQKQGLREVEPDSELNETAQYFADYMARTNKYGHTADGQRPSARAKQYGYEYCMVSENIAYFFRSTGFTTQALAEKAVTGWKESPGHRENMLEPDVTETGVAVAYSEDTGHYFAVQMFGRPKSKRFEFKVVNDAESAVEYLVGDRKMSLPPSYARVHRVCQTPKVKFILQDDGDEREKNAVVPSPGEQFVVEGQEGNLRLKEQ